jgi:HEAT repeat protein
MTDKNNNMPFPDVLKQLRQDSDSPVHLLHRLSDLKPDEKTLFHEEFPEFDPERRLSIIRQLADLVESDFLLDYDAVFGIALEDVSSEVRLAALDGLWLSENLSLVRPLIRVMEQDSVIEVRAAAAVILGYYLLNAVCSIIPRNYEQIILPALMAQLEDDETPALVRYRAMESASNSGDERLSSYIVDTYEEDSIEAQRSAIRAMGILAEERWLPTIIAEFENPSPDMRAVAATAAGDIGNAKVIPELADLTYDGHPDVDLAAVYALGAIGGGVVRRILEEISEDPDRRFLHNAVAEALEEMENPALALDNFPMDDGTWDADEGIESDPDWDEW